MNQHTGNTLTDRARKLFGEAPCRLQAAALPWRKSESGIEVMLVTSRDTGRWVLPKGWVDKGEKLWRAAEREAEEEAGLRGEVSKKAAGRYYYAKVQRAGPAVPCEVVVFPLEVAKTAEKWKEKDARQRSWTTPQRAAEMVDEPDLADLLLRFDKDH